MLKVKQIRGVLTNMQAVEFKRGPHDHCYNAVMSGESDHASENPYESSNGRCKRHERHYWPWWLRQPEVSVGGGGLLVFLLLVAALLIYNLLNPNE